MQPGRGQLADLCRIAMSTLDNERDNEPEPAHRSSDNLINVQFSITGVPNAMTCKCE